MSVVGIKGSFAGTPIVMIGQPTRDDGAHVGMVLCEHQDGTQVWLPLAGLLWNSGIRNPYEHLPQVTS